MSPKFSFCLSLVVSCILAPSVRAGTWQLPKDSFKPALNYGHWETDEKFASNEDTSLNFNGKKIKAGDRIAFDPDIPSRLIVNRLAVSLAYGITENWQLGVALPLIHVDFDTSPTDLVESNTGLGDVVTTTQYRLLDWRGVVAAGRVQWKAPTAGFDPSAYRIPLGEGQHDFLYWLALTVFPPIGYVNVDAGYKQRLENPTNERDYGDELLAAFEYGYSFESGLGLAGRLELLAGQEGTASQFGDRALPRRRLTAVALQSFYKISDTHSVNAGLRYFISGEDYPTGIQFSAGYAATFTDLLGRRQDRSNGSNG